jgi:hypothetical protein
MNRRTTLAAGSALLVLAAFAAPASAQSMKSVAGTYVLVSNAAFGEAPRGQMILGATGHYSSIIARATLPKFAAGSRLKGTPEENKAIIDGTNTHFGTYSVDDGGKTLTMNIVTASYPNWDGMVQKRPLTVKGDQLSYTVPTPSAGGAPFDVVWKKVK